MAELINCSPMPDETILGHYRRVIWVNGLRGLRELTPEVDASDLNCFEESDLRHYEAIFRLSGSRTRSVLSDYFRDHSLFVQLLTPVEIARQGGLRLLFRWSSHFAWLIPAPRVWRYCPECAQDDSKEFGFAWLKRAHQHPGVEWCMSHGLRLNIEPCFVGQSIYSSRRDMRIPNPRGQRTRSRVPPFVARYLHALSWLHKPQSVIDCHAVMDRATLLLKDQNPQVESYRLVQDNQSPVARAAPREWFLRNFRFRNDSQALRHEIALAAATVTTSTAELDSLILSATQEAREATRRAILAMRSRRDVPI